MNQVIDARLLAPSIVALRLSAPQIAAKWRAGHFVMVRPTENGERIPLTIADADPTLGTIDLVVQAVGKTTGLLGRLGPGDVVRDVAGPLGVPSEIDRFGVVAVVGGGVGTAIARPTAAALRRGGNTVIGIVGARSAGLVILEEEMRRACDELIVCTDDGTRGHAGLVTDALGDLIANRRVDRVLAIGPVAMMKAVAAVTAPRRITTVVSLNPIMVDGTGMCGGCRVTVGGTTRFACVDGPEFDAHAVDFDELARRNRSYEAWEHFRRLEFAASRAPGAGGSDG